MDNNETTGNNKDGQLGSLFVVIANNAAVAFSNGLKELVTNVNKNYKGKIKYTTVFAALKKDGIYRTSIPIFQDVEFPTPELPVSIQVVF